MAINYPTSTDSLTNPAAGDALNSPSHAAQHSDENDILEALEAKVGVNGSAVTNSVDYLLKANPEGFLINGKIVPSVANNDLTVAIKGMDGNDPSASNPVYCRIDNTVRSITAALSVTKADATNWFNAGSTELATKEIDYFVYLGYNATDGVVVGFSRIPYANEYDDFSTTTTNEKFCAISTISNAVAGDAYVNIGRFAATLSATAAFTWTVPTFTNKNLIQRPIYETRWLDWQPSYSATGSLTWTTVTTTVAKYMLSGRSMSIAFDASGTTGGTTSTTLQFTFPMAALSIAVGYIGTVARDTALNSGFMYLASTSIGAIRKYDASNWGFGANREIAIATTLAIA